MTEGEVGKKRRSRSKRETEANRPPMELTERDCELIRTVNDFRAIRGDQLQRLFFTSRSAAQYRLQRLFQHEFVDRHFLPVVEAGPAASPTIYTLAKRGAQALIDHFGLDRREIHLRKRAFNWRFLDHLLKINEVRLSVMLAAAERGFTLETWLDEGYFRAHPDYVGVATSRGSERQQPVFPDGYFCLVTPQGRSRFFLELDTGLEQLSKFAPQIRVYNAYTESGKYAERFQAKSLRILVVTSTNRRLSSLKAVTAKLGGDRKYWFTTLDAISPETILTDSIWQQLEGKTVYSLIPTT